MISGIWISKSVLFRIDSGCGRYFYSVVFVKLHITGGRYPLCVDDDHGPWKFLILGFHTFNLVVLYLVHRLSQIHKDNSLIGYFIAVVLGEVKCIS